MAKNDEDDPTGGGDRGVGGSGNNGGLPPGWESLADAIQAIYQTALGRTGSDAEIQSWIRDYGSDLATIQQKIYASPEAIAYGKSRTASTTPTPSPDTAPPAASAAPTGGAPSAPVGQNQPTFTPPGYTKPPAFSYADFVAPDPSQLQNDPTYQYTLKTEQDQIQKSAAARGVLNTGGTVNDLLLNAQDVADQGYANLYNRAMSTYQTNRQNALDQYNTNYQTQYVDPYKYKYMGAQDAFNSNVAAYDLASQYQWYNQLFDWQKQQDLFNDKYRLLTV